MTRAQQRAVALSAARYQLRQLKANLFVRNHSEMGRNSCG